LDLQDNVLLDHKFTPDFNRREGEGVSTSNITGKQTIFFDTLPYPILTQKIQLLNGAQVYDTIMVSKNGFIRILASDGLNTSTTQNIVPFTIPGNKPESTIIGPENNRYYIKGDGIVFYGQGYDPEDEILDDKVLRWTSNRNGFLGTGGTLQVYTYQKEFTRLLLKLQIVKEYSYITYYNYDFSFLKNSINLLNQLQMRFS